MNKIYLSIPLISSANHPLVKLYKELKTFGYQIVEPTPQEKYTPEFLINDSDIIIALVTEKNPQALFDLGYAIALGKKILILAYRDEEVPFYLKAYNYVKLSKEDSSEIYRVLNFLQKLSFQEEKEYPKRIEGLIDKYNENPMIIDRLSPQHFEEIVFDFLDRSGFKPERATSRVDYGYDLRLNRYRAYELCLVEIKKYNINKKVSLNTITRLLAAMHEHKAEHGILITTSTFTASVFDYVSQLEGWIELWDMNHLSMNLSQYLKSK